MTKTSSLLRALTRRGLRTGPVFFALVALALSETAPRVRADLLVLNSAGSSSHIKRFNATTGAAMNTFGHTNEGMDSLTVTSLNEVLTNSNILGGYDLYRFNAAGEYRGTLLGGEQAGLTAATRGPDGNLYVIWRDYPGETRRIVRVESPALTTFVAAGAGGMGAPSWMAFGPDRHLYVSDVQAGILRFHGTTGVSLGVFVAPGSGGLPADGRFVFGPDGHLYVPRSSTNSVLRFAGGNGALLDEFVAPASGGLINPRAVAFGPDGHLHVTSGGTRQVLRYDGRTGAFLSVAAQVEGAAGDPRINLTDIAFVRAEVAGDTIWFDDAPLAGAVTGTSHGGPWAWVTSNPTLIGVRAHRANATFTRENVAGVQEHWFNFATETMSVGKGDTLIVHVYMNSESYGQREIMLSWCDGTWSHRAYWGANLINEGASGTASRRYMGPLPDNSRLLRLEVPAALVGLEGSTVQGIAFTTVNAAGTFDRVGKSMPGIVGDIDTAPPAVRLVAPTAGATVAGWVGLGASPLIGMSFGAFGGRVTWDAAGKVGGSGADTLPPSPLITFPNTGATLSGSVTLTTTPSDEVGIARIEFAVDGVVVGSPGGPNAGGPYQPNTPLNGGTSFSITWNSATVANGSHVLTAIAYDATGNRGTSPPVTVAVNNTATTPADTTPPTVSISAPATNAIVSGHAVRLGALASDNQAVASVRFRIDGVDIGSPDTNAPFNFDWNSTTAANGSHAVTAVATDASGNQATSSAVIFSVNNTGSPATNAVIWMDSAVPANAVTGSSGGDTWNWVTTSPTPFAGTRVHQSAIAAGVHDRFFVSSPATLALSPGDTIFVYVYLDPANVPSEIMLSFHDGTWEHRAYWGSNVITYGQDGTNSRRRIGAIPAAGQWIKLEVPAQLVGPEGRAINGVSFTLVGGRATWDIIGKVSP